VVGGSNTLSYYDITWPLSHLELEGCNPETHPSHLPSGYGWPTYPWVDCASIGVSYSDTEYIVDGSCRKIIRKWKVKDWCYSNYGGWGSSNGEWTYNQVIKIIGGDEPAIMCQDSVYNNSYNCSNAYVSIPPITVEGDACGEYYSVTNYSPYADGNGADISGTYPIGVTKVKSVVKYGCFKSKTCTTYVVVTDKKGPNLYCKGDLSTALMPVDEDGDGIPEDGMIDLWAKDLDAGSTPSCNGYSLKFSFSEDPNDDVRIFTCADVGVNQVKMYATDNYGRQNFCIVNVSIQNNGANIPDCEPVIEDDDDNGGDNDSTYNRMFTIAGLVFDAVDQPMTDAKVNIVNMDPVLEVVETFDTVIIETIDTFYSGSGALIWTSVFDSVITSTIDSTETYLEYSATSGVEGNYIFNEIGDSTDVFELSATYTSTVKSEFIDQKDLNFLLQYLLGQVDFETKQQYIAADVNKDKVINFDDLKLLLDYLMAEPNETLDYEWAVIPVEEYADAKGAFEVQKSTMIMGIEGEDHVEMNWRAIKIGDIVSEDVTELKVQVTADEMATVIEKASVEGAVLETELRQLITTGPKSNTVVARPNPFLNNVKLTKDDAAAGDIVLKVMDISGKVVSQKTIKTNIGTNDINIDLTESDYRGVVFYQIIDGSDVFGGKVIRL